MRDKEFDTQEADGTLQHEAERAAAAQGGQGIMRYLAILFAAAFVLLLMSYMMQRRASDETISGLAASSISAMKSVESMLLENEALEARTEELEARVTALEAELAAATQALEEAEPLAAEWFEQREAIYALDLLRTLERAVADGDEETARAVVASLERVHDYLPGYPLHEFEGDYGGSPLARYGDLRKRLE